MADLDIEPVAETRPFENPLPLEEIMRRSYLALADRRARGEIMTYDLDGWVVREFPGQRIVRLCRHEDFRAADYPYPTCPD